ncbi:fatty acyl-AMP ligase [Mastigocoleus testarum]|uniref:AMP-dependent synthetase n=1 Tax=Mastigocoleus testarum BC008 TaxID=371196 RepID=A0A0V8A0S2_9CYAN|nr:fatty acyl-AMP ligase [Mastigocoleus testarum]KST70371.1 AMP-dependent synthetase [Mastigocoleus testarum BC008]
MLEETSNLVEILTKRALYQPEQRAYTFIQNGELESGSLTYQQLDRQARAIAAKLQSYGAVGKRALLLYPPGLEFISAFFGCLYAGVVAIPAYPPRPNQSINRLKAIVTDAQSSFALTTTNSLANIEDKCAQYPELALLNWVNTDKIDNKFAASWQEPKVNNNTLAFLQYTSGSTGIPKGVMVSHGNLLHNCRDLDLGWKHTENSVIVSWLPTFHDMGLIYGIIEPLYKACPCYLMSPLSFVMKPFRWLQAISRYQGTHSGAPNFAYELCVRKITPEQRASLDLSTWCMALNGSEPVRADILKKFAETFKPCGFNQNAFCPGYGLAEATLKVAAVRHNHAPNLYRVRSDALQQNQVEEITSEDNSQILVGCGWSEIDTKIVIVNPDTLLKCESEEIGEIWVSGKTVAQGYWQRPEETKHTFQAYIANTGEGPFLRTGDLGFIRNLDLIVTGRLKDVIIIEGRNHYPQDIELTVEASHPGLRCNSGAAFTVETNGKQRLVVVQEVERSYLRDINIKQVIADICQSVATEHDLRIHRVVLVKTGSIPKTSSGKIQRKACRANFLNQTLVPLG